MCSASLALLGGCRDTLSLDAPDVSGATATRLPRPRRRAARTGRRPAPPEVDAGTGYGAAWGDPAIELRCGVPSPRSSTTSRRAQVANGVGWFIPEEQQTGRRRARITMTTVDAAGTSRCEIPADYFPPATAMVDLAAAVKQTMREPVRRPAP